MINLTRQQGHTTAAINGIKYSGAILICGNSHQAKQLAREHNIETACVNNMESKLRGTNRPIVFDHFAVETLLIEAEQKRKNAEDYCLKYIAEVKRLKSRNWWQRVFNR